MCHTAKYLSGCGPEHSEYAQVLGVKAAAAMSEQEGREVQVKRRQASLGALSSEPVGRWRGEKGRGVRTV